jgi:hypothetical protein
MQGFKNHLTLPNNEKCDELKTAISPTLQNAPLSK